MSQPLEMRLHHAHARRLGYTRQQMLDNLESQYRADQVLKPIYDEAKAWLEVAGPEDDAGILDWRYDMGRSGRVAWLQTLNRETVGEVTRGRAAGGFYFRIYEPTCWVIESDPLAITARDEHGQAAVLTWGGPFKTRPKAAAMMLAELGKRSIALFQTDLPMVPPFKVPAL